MLTGKSAAVLFSFKRVYNILRCVKQVLGAVVANFPGELRFFKIGCQIILASTRTTVTTASSLGRVHNYFSASRGYAVFCLE